MAGGEFLDYALFFPSCVSVQATESTSVSSRRRRRESFFGSRVFSPPENGSVLPGHKPKPRGPSLTHHLP
jgi:hypothetical protein